LLLIPLTCSCKSSIIASFSSGVTSVDLLIHLRYSSTGSASTTGSIQCFSWYYFSNTFCYYIAKKNSPQLVYHQPTFVSTATSVASKSAKQVQRCIL
jgi:hypothetical protein